MLLTGLLALAACGKEEPPPYDPVADAERRERWRDVLRSSLGDAYDAPVPGLADADLERGREVFGKSCAGCHGMYARGDGMRVEKIGPPPPPDLVDPATATFLSDAAQMLVIRGGSPGTAMPPMARSLSDENLLAAYAYVLMLRQNEAANTVDHR